MSGLPAHTQGPTHPPLLEETIGANLRRIARAHAARDALIDAPTGRCWTYAEFDADVDRVALGLDALGIAKGDRVGIWSPNRPEWTLTQYATARIGAVLVNINPAYRAHELAFVLKQSGCRMLITAPAHKTSDYAAMVREVRPECDALEHVLLLDSIEWDELLADYGNAAHLPALESALTPGDPINIQYTSGTTGFPKGATLTHRNILNNGYLVGGGCRYTEEDRVCIPVPFYHCFGMVMGNLGATTHGAAMVIPAPSFDAEATLRTVQDERCTSLYGVPTMFIAELGMESFAEYDLSSLRTGIMAGSPCPTEVMKRVISDMGCREVTICYGMTETSPVSTQTRADDDVDHRVSTVGVVHPHLEIKVVDPDSGATVARGEVGEFCTRGYSVMVGYWDEPELSAQAIDADGWMHTGDLATIDDAGYVKIVGRTKDMVIRGGENVYPREVEEFLHTHPAVSDVQVVGVPDHRYGEELCAWVILTQDGAAGDDELRDHCRARLAHFKVPRYVLFCDDFPMTVTGKVQKFRLRDIAIERLGLQQAAGIETA